VTARGVVLEIEELLFDTRALRSAALHRALGDEGVPLPVADVEAAHAGVTAAMALAQLPDAQMLDVVARDLVLRRTTDNMRVSFSRELPSFSSAARNAVEQLAAEFPIAVVTRAERVDAEQMLEQAGLTAAVRVIRSLGDIPYASQHAVWHEAATRLHVSRAAAVAPDALLAAAHDAGLLTIAVGTSGGASRPTVVSLSQLTASFLSSLTWFSPSP
jgi:beta-phosphoglucomutase-like phosphatase (HAD superfamily)